MQAKLDDQKQGKKKKARKPVIQLITNDPISSSPENSSSIETQENNPTGLDKVANSTTENNSGQTNEFATSISDAPGFRRLRNPTRQAKSVVEKDNCLI